MKRGRIAKPPQSSYADEFGARLRAFRAYLNYTQSQFAECVGTNLTAILLMESGRTKAISFTCLQRLRDLCKRHNWSEDWLILGQGPMQLPDRPVNP